MGLLERFRPVTQPKLPDGAQIGFRWTSLSHQRRTSIGIDVGGGLTKIVQVRWSRKGPTLENYALAPTPPGVVEDGVLIDPTVVGDLLHTLFSAMSLKQSSVGACVGGPAIMIRHINLQRLPPEEMRMAMRFEAPQHLPVPEDQLVYDFTPIPEAAGMLENQMAVLLAGTHKKLVDSFLVTLGHAGLSPNALEIDCMAMHRVLQWNGQVPLHSQTPFVLIDIGESATRISIFRYDVPVLCRTISSGIQHLRVAVADTFQVSLTEAEKLLRLKGAKRDGELCAAVEPWMGHLVESIGRSIEFFLIQNRGALLDKVFLIGGGSALQHLPEALNNQLNTMLSGRPEGAPIHVQQVSLAGFDIRAELLPGVNHLGPILLTALGSALREGELA